MALGTNNADQILVGSNGAAFTAPRGTTLPTAYDTSLNSAFKPVGYISPAGPGVDSKPTTKDIDAWQSFFPIASRISKIDGTVKFDLMEWDANTLPFAFGGGVITEPTPDHYTFTPSAPDVIDERAMVVDVHDGPLIVRFVFERGYQVGGFSTKFTRDEAAVLPIEWKILAASDGGRGIKIHSNSPAFDAAIAAS